MKVVILAGGAGSRLSEETDFRPKPMVEIGNKPMLWHIMKNYSSFGFNDFIICLGHKGYMIKEYFANYFLHMCDVTLELKSNKRIILQKYVEPWKVTLVDTGEETLTGTRLQRIKGYLGDETFMMTYGDGLADVDIGKLIQSHRKNKKLATITSVCPPGRFGALKIEGERAVSFLEKPKGDGSWINGGFFVLDPGIFDYIKKDNVAWEGQPLCNLAKDSQLYAYKHNGFWKAVDTLRDKRELEALWNSGRPPWKLWR